MKKEVIVIGGGIVGSTTAFYLSQNDHIHVTLVDHGVGNATRAAAGIICPWLSQRRNKDWYALTSAGAAFYLKLMEDMKDKGIAKLPYKQTGTLVFKNKVSLLEKLEKLARKRREDAPHIGQVSVYPDGHARRLVPPLSTHQGAVFAAGGGRVDGGLLVDQLQDLIQQAGGTIIREKAELHTQNQVNIRGQIQSYDTIVLACGAWLKETLAPLGYQVDVRPQKGQLIEVQTDFNTKNWPGCMLHCEIDILPFENGKLVIGASHEDNQGFDLTADQDLSFQMKQTAEDFIPSLAGYTISHTRVGTRAYTSDYSPFYGQIPEADNIWAISGLGSSGLTSGPFIGWQVAQEILGHKPDFDRTPYTTGKYILKKLSELSF